MYIYIDIHITHTYIYIYIYMVFTTDGFLEVAIESWPEWDLNPRPLRMSSTRSQSQLCTATPIYIYQ